MFLILNILASLWLIILGLASFKLYADRDKRNFLGEFFRAYLSVREARNALVHKIFLGRQNSGCNNRDFKWVLLYTGYFGYFMGMLGLMTCFQNAHPAFIIAIGTINMKMYLGRASDNRWGILYREIELTIKLGEMSFTSGCFWLLTGCYGIVGGFWHMVF